MTQINKPAIGFLGMLESQQMGRTPAFMADQVIAGVDMFPFWEAQDLTHSGIVGPALLPSASGQTIANFFVPATEAWVPIHCNVEGVVETAGGFASLDININRAPRVTDTAQMLIKLASMPVRASLIADEFFGLEYTWQQRQLLMPAQSVQVRCRQLSGSNMITTRGRLAYWRIPI